MVPWWPIDNRTERVHTGSGRSITAELSILACGGAARVDGAAHRHTLHERHRTSFDSRPTVWPNRTRNRIPSDGHRFRSFLTVPPANINRVPNIWTIDTNRCSHRSLLSGGCGRVGLERSANEQNAQWTRRTFRTSTVHWFWTNSITGSQKTNRARP